MKRRYKTCFLGLGVPYDALLGRYRLTLDLFGRVFVDSVGLEPGSIISELGGFPVKEAKFRKEMEKLRNSRTSDLTLNKIERERSQLIITAFKEFNNHYQNHTKRSMSHPPMVVNRVKVSSFLFYVVCIILTFVTLIGKKDYFLNYNHPCHYWFQYVFNLLIF